MGLIPLPVAIGGYREFLPASRKPTNHAAYSAPRRCVWCIAHLRAILALRASQSRPRLRQQAVRYRKGTVPVHFRCIQGTPQYALSTSTVHSQYVHFSRTHRAFTPSERAYGSPRAIDQGTPAQKHSVASPPPPLSFTQNGLQSFFTRNRPSRASWRGGRHAYRKRPL